MPETRPSQLLPVNPFATRESSLEVQRYQQKIMELARRFIYNDEDIHIMEERIRVTRKDPAYAGIEQTRHQLESLAYLFRGSVAHEQANLYHRGAWQAALVLQDQQKEAKPKPPEKLTRKEVDEKFSAFRFRDRIMAAEKEALKNYHACAELQQDAHIPLTPNITLQRADLEVLINDLENRLAERIEDDVERRTQLNELDQNLRIIQGLHDDDWKTVRVGGNLSFAKAHPHE